MKKRILAFLFAAVLSFSLAACAAEPAGNPSDEVSGSEAFTGSAVTDSDAVTDSTNTDTTDPESSETSSESEKLPLPEPSTPPAEEERTFVNEISGLVAITDQKNGKIVVLDLSKENPAAASSVVWQWKASKSDMNFTGGSHLDDVKLREVYGGLFNGTVVGVTTSGGLVAVVEYPSGKCLFNANASGWGPHDIEILPNGLVAVALSGNGNASKSSIRIYRASSKYDTEYVELSINSGHGILWDPQWNVLWGLGGTELNAYEVGGSPSTKPTLTKKSGMGASKFSGGHCLAPVYGNTDRLWISTGTSVLQFSKSENKIYYDYPEKLAVSVASVKGVGSFANGCVVSCVADKNNATASHNSNVLRLAYYRVWSDGTRELKTKKITFPDRDFYKVRVFDANYQ